MVAAAWCFFLISIVFGLMTLMALTGNLETASNASALPSIRSTNVRVPAILQILCFLIGMLLTILFGVLAA
jgi:hypothetical protein